MAKVLCLVLPLRSHINAHTLLAETLRERGHEFVFAAMADAQKLIESYGFECTPLFADRLPQGSMQGWLSGDVVLDTWKKKLDFYLGERRKIIEHERFVEYLIQGGYRDFLRAVESIAPDVILVDNGLHTYWALMARRTGIPCLYTSNLLPIEEDPVIPPLDSLLTPATDATSREGVRRAWHSGFRTRWMRAQAMKLAGIPDSIANFRRLARATDCPAKDLNTRTLLFPALKLPTIIFCPREFEFPEALGRTGRHYVESFVNLNRPEPAFPWEKLIPGKRLIFCSLGSVAFNRYFFQKVIDAFASEPGWQLVMTIGPKLSPADFEHVPDGTILVDYAPQLGLLRRASAMINHGGINSVRECLYFGVPQVSVPLFFDQKGAAARVAYHGVGLIGNIAAAPADIHALLTRILSEESFRQQSFEMSKAFQSRQRERAGAGVIESYLRQESLQRA